MKKLIPLIILAPFIIISFYYVIDKYIYWLFDVKDNSGATFISLMLTMIQVIGIGTLFAIRKNNK